ncbi:MAG TPA: flagellar filament capping protein FliD [Spirochaetota bacterium]|nr:flagellar filament capping protein FliD [Spirochaetota bacterium]
MPVTMGGMASGMDTDSIISKLVEVEAQPIKKLQRNKLVNNQKKEALNKLSSTLKDLDSKTRDLYGFRASYDEKKVVSSDTSVIDAVASKQADADSKKIEVLQLASFHKVSSDKIDSEKKLPSGKIIIDVNGVEKSISFKGGRLKSLNEAIMEEASSVITSEYVNTEDKNYLIGLTSKVPGKKGEIKIKGSEELLKESGFILGEKVKSQDDTPVVFDRKFFSAYEGEKIPDGQNGTLSIGTDGKEIKLSGFLWQEYEIPVKADVKKDSILKFGFNYKKEIEENIPYMIETGPDDEINVKGIKLKSYNISRLRPLTKKEEKKFDSVTGIGVVAVDNGKRTEKIYPIDADTAKKQEIPVGRDFEGKQISKLIFYSNDGEATFTEPVVSTPVKTKGEFELKNIIAEAGNAKLKIDGLEIERDKNDGLTDVVKGLTLNLKRKSELPVELKTSQDIDKPILKIKAFVESYNYYMELNKSLTKTVKVDKPGQSEKLDESGIFVGDMMMVRLENSIKTTVGGAYPSREEKPVKMFNQMGVSTGKINSSWQTIKEGKLVMDEDELRKVILENPEGVKSFFGSDTDGDNKIDNGMAYTLVKTIDPYISSGKNIIATKIEFEDDSIKMANEKIKQQETHLKSFEEKLRKKFATMEKSISGSKAQQNWMKGQMGGNSGGGE